MINRYGFIVNDIGNFIFGLAEAAVYVKKFKAGISQ